MKTGPVNLYKKGSFSMDAINYYFYEINVRPYYQPNKKWVTITIVVEYDHPGIFRRIHSNYVETIDEDNEPELFEYSDLHCEYMRTRYNLQTAQNRRIPIMKLIKSKWGENYIESIFNYVYSELEGQIPYSEFNVTKDINDLKSKKSEIYANEVLLFNDFNLTEEVFNEYNLIIKGIRRRHKLNRISERMNSLQYKNK